jgi:hypothetical protein
MRMLRRIDAPLLAVLAGSALAACDGEHPAAPPGEEACAARALSLRPGESAALDEARAACFRLEGPAEAEYALAYVDTRQIARAADGAEWEYDWEREETYDVALSPAALRGPPPAASRAPAPPRRPTPPDGPVRARLESEHATGDYFFLREEPWREGDRLLVFDHDRDEDRWARVLRVYDGRYVVAWREGDSPDSVARYLAQVDSAMPFVRAWGERALRDAYGDGNPVSSPGSGQLLWILRAMNPDEPITGTTFWFRPSEHEGRLVTWIELRMVSRPLGWPSMARHLLHELTHAYQVRYLDRTRVWRADEFGGWPFWGIEGAANLVALEAIRRAAGVELDGDWDWRAPGADPLRRYYGPVSQLSQGLFSWGYYDSQGFLHDQMVRRVRGGESPAEALGQVARGAVEGWYGRDYYGYRRPGLAARMRLGAGWGWDPADALLTWTLSHAADDRTESRVFQNPTFLRTWDLPDGFSGWRPDAVLAQGEAATARRPWGSPGFTYLRGGGPWRAAASVEGVRYRVLRIR